MNKDYRLIEAINRDKAPFENYLLIDYGHTCVAFELEEKDDINEILFLIAEACPEYEIESAPSGIGQYSASIKTDYTTPNDVTCWESTDFNAFPRH